MNFHYKNDHLIFTMEIPILKRQSLYWEGAQEMIHDNGILYHWFNPLRLSSLYVSLNRGIIGSDDFSFLWCQAIIWTITALFSFESLETNFKIPQYSYKIFFFSKMLFVKWNDSHVYLMDQCVIRLCQGIGNPGIYLVCRG